MSSSYSNRTVFNTLSDNMFMLLERKHEILVLNTYHVYECSVKSVTSPLLHQKPISSAVYLLSMEVYVCVTEPDERVLMVHGENEQQITKTTHSNLVTE